MNNLQKGLAHGFWNSRSQVFRRMAFKMAAPDLLAWARVGLDASVCASASLRVLKNISRPPGAFASVLWGDFEAVISSPL